MKHDLIIRKNRTDKIMRKLVLIFATAALIFSCQKSSNFPVVENMEVTSAFVLNNSIIIAQGNCAGDSRTHTYICFDSVVGDSRCPRGVECIWEGNGEARFKFMQSDDAPLFFNLNTHLGFTNDTIVGGYKFTLKALNPYPSIQDVISQKVYSAEIEIEKESR
jgi:hypothetical protein